MHGNTPRRKLSDRSSLNGPPAPDPDRGIGESERLKALAHELNTMLDGSMRSLRMATRSIPVTSEIATNELDTAREQIDRAHRVLEQMSSVVASALGGAVGSIGFGSEMSLGEAIHHAVDVVEPYARERKVGVEIVIEGDVGTAPARSAYTVVLNALKNAVEATPIAGQSVRIRCAPSGGESVLIEVTDHGSGPPAGQDPFAFGFTTREGGSGIGLALAAAASRSMQGTIELSKREDARGTLLRFEFPRTGPSGDETIGGA